MSNAPDVSKDGGRNTAYALYVLARNGIAPLGELRYLADAKLADIGTPIAKAQVAAALGLLGDRTRAETVYKSALDDLVPAGANDAVQPRGLRLGAARRGRPGGAREPKPAARKPMIVNAGGQDRAGEARTSWRAPRAGERLDGDWPRAPSPRMPAGVSLDVAGSAQKGPLFRNVQAVT